MSDRPPGTGGSGPGERRGTAADAGLALLALLGVLAAGSLAGARPHPTAAGAGALGAVVLEAILGRYHSSVRAAWRRPATAVVTALAGAVCVGVGLRVAPSPTASLVAGGLAAYLLLVALVRAGALAPPRAW